jgi:hypothetical protein
MKPARQRRDIRRCGAGHHPERNEVVFMVSSLEVSLAVQDGKIKEALRAVAFVLAPQTSKTHQHVKTIP